MEQLQESSQKEVARAEQLEQERCQEEQQTKRLQQVIETVRESSDRQQAELQVSCPPPLPVTSQTRRQRDRRPTALSAGHSLGNGLIWPAAQLEQMS